MFTFKHPLSALRQRGDGVVAGALQSCSLPTAQPLQPLSPRQPRRERSHPLGVERDPPFTFFFCFPSLDLIVASCSVLSLMIREVIFKTNFFLLVTSDYTRSVHV